MNKLEKMFVDEKEMNVKFTESHYTDQYVLWLEYKIQELLKYIDLNQASIEIESKSEFEE